MQDTETIKAKIEELEINAEEARIDNDYNRVQHCISARLALDWVLLRGSI